MLGWVFSFIGCFTILMLIILNAPEYIENEDGSLVPKSKEKKSKRKDLNSLEEKSDQ